MSKPFTLHPFEVKAAKDGRLLQIRRPLLTSTRMQWIWANADLGRGVEDTRAGYPWYEDGDGYRHIVADLYLNAKPPITLWARETFCICKEGTVYYQEEQGKGCVAKIISIDPFTIVDFKWCSPIIMPRWASRFDIHVKDVRIERLQDTTNLDAAACGMLAPFNTLLHAPKPEQWKWVWNKQYAKQGYGWDTNPWVWVADVKTEVKK